MQKERGKQPLPPFFLHIIRMNFGAKRLGLSQTKLAIAPFYLKFNMLKTPVGFILSFSSDG